MATTTEVTLAQQPHGQVHNPRNLLEEPWIRCRHQDGSVVELSVLDVFTQAPHLRHLAGELPTQDAAIVRLLLAVGYRTLAQDPSGDPEAVWQRWWQQGCIDPLAVRTYLSAYAHRFNLFDARAPFYQVGDLHTAKNQWSSLHRLIAEVPSGTQFFTTRAAEGVNELSYAEAARWLVHAQSFDTSGIKSGAVGDDRVKGGKGYSNGLPSWTGNLGLVMCEGETLAQTLLLNLVADENLVDADGDSAQWERPPLGAAVSTDHDQPLGVADLLTWSDRRLRLRSADQTNQKVDGVIIANGDFLHPLNMNRHELMTSWRVSEAQAKRNQLAQAFMPITHDPTKDLWRGLAGLLATQPQGHQARPTAPAAGVLDWLSNLTRHGTLREETVVRVRAIGMAYGGQNATVAAIVDDLLNLPLAVISEQTLKQLAVDAVDDAEQAVRALRTCAKRLCLASGGDPTHADGSREAAAATAYFRLRRPFETWVAQLGPTTEVATARRPWQQTVFYLVMQVAREIIDQAGRPALIGREISDGYGITYMDAARAEGLLVRDLARALPHRLPTQHEQQHSMDSVSTLNQQEEEE